MTDMHFICGVCFAACLCISMACGIKACGLLEEVDYEHSKTFGDLVMGATIFALIAGVIFGSMF